MPPRRVAVPKAMADKANSPCTGPLCSAARGGIPRLSGGLPRQYDAAAAKSAAGKYFGFGRWTIQPKRAGGRRAPYASDPGGEPRAPVRRAAEPDPHRLRARPRPRHPFHRLPPAEGENPGLSVRRGRSLPHPPDPYAGGGADRPGARPRAPARRGPGRGAGARPRSRPSALRPCRRAGAGRGDGRIMAASTTTPRACAWSRGSSAAIPRSTGST